MSNYNELKLTYQGGRQETITLTVNTIDYGAYQRHNIVAVEVPEIVQTIEGYAFCDNNDLANIVLNEGLERIEGQAFQHGVYTAVTIPSTVTYIGWNAFNTRDEQDRDQHTFTLTCLASTPPRLEDWEGITFGDPGLLSAIYVPDGSVSAYQEAWRDYASKIQGGAVPAPTGDILTNLSIKAAYVGDVEVVKMYLGDDVVWEPEPCSKYEEGTQEKCECEGRYWWDNSCHDEPEPDPCEGLTGESLCNCQGRYWWGGECHDVPDTMLTTPLTFEITSVGTGSTGSIGLRLSGDTSSANRRPLTYYLTHEGTETRGNLNLNEAASSSAITSLITGLTVGDKIVFWGWGDQRGMSVSESAFEYFVTSAGVTAKVYGNVNSLLFSGYYYHGSPVPQTAETAAYAFYKLFYNKTGFTFGAPGDLQHIVLPVPANGLQNSIYREMFYGCTNMTTAPELPATTLAASCYRSMFNGAGLTTAPELPATTMADYAYLSMFADCPITQAPALPATTLSQYCYTQMFRGTNITDMPDLPATTLAQYCYQGMFSGCTSLTGVTAELPALRVEPYCYQNMFDGCTRLATAPALPATTLANFCYEKMFQGCTSLTTSPELPATTLVDTCYGAMFSGCSSLNYIKCLATVIGPSWTPCTSYWVSGVASNGTFVKDASMTGWRSGVSGIPGGWTIEDAEV